MSTPKQQPPYKLPKGTLARIVLAHSFAEYDTILQKQGVFVETPAARAASDGKLGKCIFVGRRGSGKTAINLHLSGSNEKTVVQLYPKCLTSVGQSITAEKYADTRQRPFHLLTLAFKQSLALEAVGRWISVGAVSKHDLPETLTREKSRVEQMDFDSRVLDIFEEIEPTLGPGQDKQYFKCARRLSNIVGEINALPNTNRWRTTIVIDKVDDDWDGADESVIVLMALMHACVELTSVVDDVRPLLFLRENLFERVRRIDNEFSRLETSVASLDWTKELLSDLVVKRFQYHLNPKPPLPQVWDAFFEHRPSTDICDQVFDYCQFRPRDILIYLFHAIENSKASKHEQITDADLEGAKKVFQDLVGEVVKFCFFHTLANPHKECSNLHGRVRRDWIFSNRAGTDFWRMVLDQHKATQIIWECKNYEDITAGDFQQLAYYLNKDLGTFIIVSCRGLTWDKPVYYEHIQRISGIHDGAMVIILTDSDLKAFLRQASKGSVKDGLLRDRYDKVKQKIT